jgi:hypothetical protein
MLKSTALSQDIERWQFKIAVDLACILMKRASQRRKLAELALKRIYEILFLVL